MLIHAECIRGRSFITRGGASLAFFGCVDGFCGSRRVRKRLGCLGPVEFEEKCCAGRAAAERTNVNPCQPALTG